MLTVSKRLQICERVCPEERQRPSVTSVCYGWIKGHILPAPRQGVPIVARMRRSSAEHEHLRGS